MDKPESQKFTHDQVGYENPSTHRGEQCVGCEHFIPATLHSPTGCEGVQRPIQSGAWCHRFESKRADVVKEAAFFMARHGETMLNESGKYRGWSNGPDARLNRKGIRQASAAGHFLLKLPVNIVRIYCSDLDRSKHTAAIIGAILGITEIHSDKRLRPLNVGELAGKDKAKTPIDYWVANTAVAFPGGESIDEFDAREADFAKELLSKVLTDSDEKDLIVCHVSNIMYWENLHQKSDEYLDEKTDLVMPGGVVAVTHDAVVPLFRENKARK